MAIRPIEVPFPSVRMTIRVPKLLGLRYWIVAKLIGLASIVGHFDIQIDVGDQTLDVMVQTRAVLLTALNEKDEEPRNSVIRRRIASLTEAIDRLKP